MIPYDASDLESPLSAARMCGHSDAVNITVPLCNFQIIPIADFIQHGTESVIIQPSLRRFSEHFQSLIRRIAD